MTKTPSISTTLAGYQSAESLNTSLTTLKDHFQGFVSRDGSAPNHMTADFDLNGNDLLNVGTTNTDNLFVSGVKVTDAKFVPSWESSWLTSTAYQKNDLVRQDGNVYICLVDHTSGTFSTDLTQNKWELFASKGSAGVGTGDLLSTNNLSDVVDAATSRSNLGLGEVATENILPITKGGTGASTVANARTALGLGTAALVDIIDEDSFATDSATRPPSQQSVKALFSNKYCIVSDQKSSGTSAGSFVSGWNTRALTTISTNVSGVSLASNAVTLTEGTWEVEAEAGAYNCNYHRLRLFNNTSGLVVEGPVALNAYARSTGDAHVTIAVLQGVFTLTATSDILLQHRASGFGPTVLMGVPCSFGDNEVYSIVKFRKVSP